MMSCFRKIDTKMAVEILTGVQPISSPGYVPTLKPVYSDQTYRYFEKKIVFYRYGNDKCIVYKCDEYGNMKFLKVSTVNRMTIKKLIDTKVVYLKNLNDDDKYLLYSDLSIDFSLIKKSIRNYLQLIEEEN